MREANTETAETNGASTRDVAIQVGDHSHRFAVWCSAYVAGKLKPEDWHEAQAQTQTSIDGAIAYLMLNGVLPSTCADELHHRAESIMRGSLNDAFRRRNVSQGNLAYQVDPMLSGEEYRV